MNIYRYLPAAACLALLACGGEQTASPPGELALPVEEEMAAPGESVTEGVVDDAADDVVVDVISEAVSEAAPPEKELVSDNRQLISEEHSRPAVLDLNLAPADESEEFGDVFPDKSSTLPNLFNVPKSKKEKSVNVKGKPLLKEGQERYIDSIDGAEIRVDVTVD